MTDPFDLEQLKTMKAPAPSREAKDSAMRAAVDEFDQQKSKSRPRIGGRRPSHDHSQTVMEHDNDSNDEGPADDRHRDRHHPGGAARRLSRLQPDQ
jgi:hypothetical protein